MHYAQNLKYIQESIYIGTIILLQLFDVLRVPNPLLPISSPRTPTRFKEIRIISSETNGGSEFTQHNQYKLIAHRRSHSNTNAQIKLNSLYQEEFLTRIRRLQYRRSLSAEQQHSPVRSFPSISDNSFPYNCHIFHPFSAEPLR